MNAVIPLGRFERVPLREAWPTEDGNFTPWLAQAESITTLGEALNTSLEVDAVEERVGDFRADILARAADEPDEHLVIIENQFGKTDHGHLGQLLTYLAGVEGCKTVVWIAETIQPSHRAAIDWLNLNTTEEYSFFAIEIELWRIGSSPAAPRFNVIASPNDWTRNVRAATRQVKETELSERHHIRMAYWASFAEFLKKSGSTFRISRPNKFMWKWFSIGKAGIGISATISIEKKRAGVELYIQNDVGKICYRTLYGQRDAIEREFGEKLDWQELPGKKASRIALYKISADPADEAQFGAIHAWMLEKMNRFRQVFAARVKSLPTSRSSVLEDEEIPIEE